MNDEGISTAASEKRETEGMPAIQPVLPYQAVLTDQPALVTGARGPKAQEIPAIRCARLSSGWLRLWR